MMTALAHRGPDDRGREVRGQVGLVNTRLAVVDPSDSGRQPMLHRDGRWLLSYNGEIYNHADLRRQLPPYEYRSRSDTETLLHALATWGEEALPACNGQFAFAALDLARRRLLLGRDRFGVKPLYVAHTRRGIWFASELCALVAAGVARRPRREVIAHAVSNGWAPGRHTPIEGVERVLPGTIVTVDLDTLEIHERWWYEPAASVDPDLARELAARPRRELARRLETALRTSVRRRLMADVPVATMCSGGLDSTLVTAFAREESPRLTSFNAALEGPVDEGRWARRAARALGVDLDTVRIGAEGFREDLVDAIAHCEYPLENAGAVSISRMACRARALGVKVLLTGEGADELFGGYEHRLGGTFRAFLPARSRVPRLLHRAHLDGVRLGLATARQRLQKPRGAAPSLFEQAPEALRFSAEVAGRAATAYEHHAGRRGEIEATLLEEMSRHPLPHLLNRMDKNAMGESVEVRVPFLDPDVVRLVLNMPLEARIGPLPKGALRDVAAQWLPPALARRPKYPGLSPDVRRGISEWARPEFVEDGYLRQLFELPSSTWREYLGVVSPGQAFRAWTSEIWCRLMLEGTPVSEVEAALWRDAG